MNTPIHHPQINDEAPAPEGSDIDGSLPTSMALGDTDDGTEGEFKRPVVTIVGRPNVGKSTLMNRVLGKRVAIVEDFPGVTRDRKEVDAEWLGREFILVDTGGWMPGGSALEAKVSRQVEKAVTESDLVLFVVDASVGPTDEDAAVADWLKRADRPVLVVANKADNDRRETEMWEFLSFGLGDPVPISALHGRRCGDLLDHVVARLPAIEGASTEDADDTFESQYGDDSAVELLPDVPAVAIVGRPNVGKSTLFNRLIGDDRAVVHDMPGTTRDAIDTVVNTVNGMIKFVDTAGMRRKARIDDSTEYYSFVRALRAVDESDVALLVIDSTEGVSAQDQRLAERVDASGCPIVIVLNKWDLITDAEHRSQITIDIAHKLHFLSNSPVVKISALTGKGVHKLLPVLADAVENYHRRVPTQAVNKVIAAAQQAQPAPHQGKILYAVQGATDPPTFTLFANKDLAPAYLRYIERRIREEFKLGSVPIKLRVRKRSA
jgi:GTPase